MTICPKISQFFRAGVVALFVSQYATPGYAVNFADPKYQGCIGLLSAFTEVDPDVIPDGNIQKGDSLDLYGGRVKVADLTNSDYDYIEHKLGICMDLENRKLSSEMIHVRVERTRRRIESQVSEAKRQADSERKAIDHNRKIQTYRAELSTFSGRLMSESEIERAKHIAWDMPELKGDVDHLLSMQAEILETQADMENERRIELERRRQETEEARRVDAERQAFWKSAPNSCQDGLTMVKTLRGKGMQDNMQQMVTLFSAGDSEGACKLGAEFADTTEQARAKLVECSHPLDGNTGATARTVSAGVLSEAMNIHVMQMGLIPSLKEMHCSD